LAQVCPNIGLKFVPNEAFSRDELLFALRISLGRTGFCQ
jgi:hypothetical protein